jgi:hypothetical protein
MAVLVVSGLLAAGRAIRDRQSDHERELTATAST